MIKGKKINLRLVEERDLELFLKLNNDLELRGEHIHIRLSPQVEFRNAFNQSGFWDDKMGRMLVTDKEDRIIGYVVYFSGSWYIPGYEVGYAIYKEEDRGKGYMTEAFQLFISYLFALKPIQRLQLTLNEGNEASRAVAKKCGFKFEGVLRNASFTLGKYHNIELYSLLREECLNFNEHVKPISSREL